MRDGFISSGHQCAQEMRFKATCSLCKKCIRSIGANPNRRLLSVSSGTVARDRVVPHGPGYTGRVNDPDTALVYMQARYCDPETGRFLSVDPAKVSAGDTFGFNRYAYANNSSLRFVDPNGRESADLTYRSVTAMTPPSPEASGFVLGVVADMTPGVSTAKGIYCVSGAEPKQHWLGGSGCPSRREAAEGGEDCWGRGEGRQGCRKSSS